MCFKPNGGSSRQTSSLQILDRPRRSPDYRKCLITTSQSGIQRKFESQEKLKLQKWILQIISSAYINLF